METKVEELGKEEKQKGRLKGFMFLNENKLVIIVTFLY